ncbi:hypothetical protein [Pediococcus pentosaceus]|uniref:hypothetical protein n=1 Tax=Pediococcus pentosaceus TaxID=1255 RepID=UPI00136335D0|nr:hypothetical protein [Pediococcus pentosaceus]MCG7196699.1 hypothetical protein [Pediococcus pentosaceus]MCI2396371.1 hypothetical protein [Pediococcus pentosaceus]QHM64681.1 hypothetical protein C7M48_00386 [Pediococcus pentosaceus]QHM66400.1 hypothetical protein C7M49_00299 [Pediococcus pentosaceus]QHM69447.1 hypothetical protein C7M50_01578 [Pediococcus pentosaceus]
MNNTSEKIVAELEKLHREASTPQEIVNQESFKKIWQFLDTDDYIKYSPISKFAFQNDEIAFFKQALQEAVPFIKDKKFYTSKAERHFLKILDHMELVSIQGHTIDDRQQSRIDKQNDELKKLKQDLKDTKEELQKIKESTTTLSNKLTVDFVTILGIFTSITFATFGGLQLLGNVFGNIKSVDSASVGSELMLGAVFLFGTYMILIALLTGLSRLMGREYRTSFPTRFLIVSSFFALFMFGLIYSNIDSVDIFTTNAGWWMIFAIFCMVVSLYVGWKMDCRYEESRINKYKKNSKK